VEKLPVLTLSNRPFKLIASVETFDCDIKIGFGFAAVDFFSNDCRKSENFVENLFLFL
jgi:hypothetical protein